MPMIYYSPLEQFEIISLIPILKFNNLFLNFTNSTLFMCLILFSLCLIFYFITLKIQIIPTRWQSVIEVILLFTQHTLITKNVGPKGTPFFPFMFFLFFFLILSNLIGMIPYSFTMTSHIFVTFSLAFMLFLGMNIIAIQKHKLHFLNLFLPSGIHIALAPLLVPIELVSYIASVFSLAIRLFANMMSGHTLLKMIAGFAWTMLSFGGIWYLLHLFPLLIIGAVTLLELGIALLQAYVFTILMCLYLKDALELTH